MNKNVKELKDILISRAKANPETVLKFEIVVHNILNLCGDANDRVEDIKIEFIGTT